MSTKMTNDSTNGQTPNSTDEEPTVSMLNDAFETAAKNLIRAIKNAIDNDDPNSLQQCIKRYHSTAVQEALNVYQGYSDHIEEALIIKVDDKDSGSNYDFLQYACLEGKFEIVTFLVELPTRELSAYGIPALNEEYIAKLISDANECEHRDIATYLQDKDGLDKLGEATAQLNAFLPQKNDGPKEPNGQQ